MYLLSVCSAFWVVVSIPSVPNIMRFTISVVFQSYWMLGIATLTGHISVEALTLCMTLEEAREDNHGAPARSGVPRLSPHQRGEWTPIFPLHR